MNLYRYNAMSHPIPFMKASNVTAPKAQPKEVPDLEEAVEDDDAAEVVEAPEADEDDDEIDFKKDKYIKKPKAKKATKKTSKATAADEEDEEDKPKRGRAKATGTKAKAKK